MASINYAAISKFTDELGGDIISRFITENRLIDSGISVQTGIQYEMKLNIINDAFTVKLSDCAWSPTDNDIALSQRTIKVCTLENENGLCVSGPEGFDQYWIGQYQKQYGANAEILPTEFNKIYTADKMKLAKAKVEAYFWNGSTTNDNFAGGTSSAFNLCDGILQVLDNTGASQSVINGGTGAITAANIVAKIQAMIALQPQEILAQEDLTLFLSYGNFNLLQTALLNANLYHVNVSDGPTYKMLFPGSNVMVVAQTMPATRLILTPASNLVLGTDLKSDWETFKVWYDPNTDQIRNRIKWRQGAQVKFPQYVVEYKA